MSGRYGGGWATNVTSPPSCFEESSTASAGYKVEADVKLCQDWWVDLVCYLCTCSGWWQKFVQFALSGKMITFPYTELKMHCKDLSSWDNPRIKFRFFRNQERTAQIALISLVFASMVAVQGGPFFLRNFFFQSGSDYFNCVFDIVLFVRVFLRHSFCFSKLHIRRQKSEVETAGQTKEVIEQGMLSFYDMWEVPFLRYCFGLISLDLVKIFAIYLHFWVLVSLFDL